MRGIFRGFMVPRKSIYQTIVLRICKRQIVLHMRLRRLISVNILQYLSSSCLDEPDRGCTVFQISRNPTRKKQALVYYSREVATTTTHD